MEYDKEYFLAQFPNSAQYKISLYAVFMEAGLKLTRSSGYQSYIIPDSFLLGKYFSAIREFILKRSRLQSIIMFHEDFWESGTVGCPVVYVICSQDAIQPDDPHGVTVLLTQNLENFTSGKWSADKIPQKFFAESTLYRLRLIQGEEKRKLCQRLETVGMPLEQFVKFYSGLIGRKGQDSITIVKPHDYSPIKYGKLIPSSGNLKRHYVEYDDFYCPKEPQMYKSGYKPEIYENPKLFLNQTGDHLKCAYDGEGYYCLNNMHVGYPINTDRNLRFIATLMCSRLMDFYYKSVSMEEGRANAQTDIDVIDILPIRRIAFTTPAAERNRQAKRGQEIYETALNKNDPAAVLKFVEQELKANRSDVVHDLLAFLAEQMMTLNKDKQVAARKFLADLKDFHGVDVHSLKPKTKLDEFWQLEVSDLFAHLRANAKLLALQNVRLKESDEEKIRDRFQKAKTKIIPLESAISFADRLIDQIVYRLYGLTDEEISIMDHEK